MWEFDATKWLWAELCGTPFVVAVFLSFFPFCVLFSSTLATQSSPSQCPGALLFFLFVCLFVCFSFPFFSRIDYYWGFTVAAVLPRIGRLAYLPFWVKSCACISLNTPTPTHATMGAHPRNPTPPYRAQALSPRWTGAYPGVAVQPYAQVWFCIPVTHVVIGRTIPILSQFIGRPSGCTFSLGVQMDVFTLDVHLDFSIISHFMAVHLDADLYIGRPSGREFSLGIQVDVLILCQLIGHWASTWTQVFVGRPHGRFNSLSLH